MEQQFKQFEELSVLEFYKIISERIAIFVVEQNCPYQEADELDLIAFHHFFTINDELVAYNRIYMEKNVVHIGRVIVKENQRKNGMGMQLMQTTLAEITERFPGQKIEISAQAHLQNFYGKVGFVTVSDEYLEDNIPHVRMTIEPK